MKKLAVVVLMLLMVAFAPVPPAESAEVDCVDCSNQHLVDESSIDEVRTRARSLSSLAELPEIKDVAPAAGDFRGFEHPASSAARPMGRAPSVMAEEAESFSIH